MGIPAIAVDEADWRFNNLTAQQVYIIREKSNQPAFQGIEKSMFYRICRFLTLNIHLLFVFDGPRRPYKRGRGGQGKIDYERLRLLKEMLRYFRIPYHEAPGEAEAECARLQQLHVVDAVFSQDSDTLMFGCDFLIRDDRVAKDKGNNNRSKENTKKSASSVRIVRGHDLKEKHRLGRESLVLFAMLVGGDYDMKGLEKCGPGIAIRAVDAGLGTSLCRCRTQTDCREWREQLVEFLQKERRFSGSVPFGFPDIKTLNKYNRPTVSSDEQLLNLRGLRNGWNSRPDELELLELTSSRFNIWGAKYMNWIAPVLLTKFLATRDPQLPCEQVHQIKLINRRVKKSEDGRPLPPPLERKLTFSPFGLTTLQQNDFEGSRAGYWTGAVSDPFDNNYRVETEIPMYLLEKVLPPEILDPSKAPKETPKKRKQLTDAGADADDHDTSTPVAKKKRTTTGRLQDDNRGNSNISGHDSKSTPKQATRAGPAQPRRSDVECINLLSDSEDDVPPIRTTSNVIIDLCHDLIDSEVEEEQLGRGNQQSLRHASYSPADPLQRNITQQHLGGVDRTNGEPRLLNESSTRTMRGSPAATTTQTPTTKPSRQPNQCEGEPSSTHTSARRREAMVEPDGWFGAFSVPDLTNFTTINQASGSLKTSLLNHQIPWAAQSSTTELSAGAVGNRNLSDAMSLAEVRSARLRYFNAPTTAPIDLSSVSTSDHSMQPTEFRRGDTTDLAYRLPEIEEIDLTDL